MKISTKGEYGIRAMLYLAMAGGDRAVPSHEIAIRQAIPEPYLRQILAQLSKDGLIQSSRGPQGGHLLGRQAAAISLRDVLLSLEGQTTSIDQILALPCNIDLGTEHCAIREVFLEVKRSVEEILARTSLAELAERQRQVLAEDISIPLDTAGAAGHPALPVLAD
jgi:Rrf2 family protein